MMTRWLLLPAFALMVAMSSAQAQFVDKKALPGTVCVPANPTMASKFRYKNGTIRNRDGATRNVECPILRDKFDGDLQFENLDIFISQPEGETTECTASVQVIRTGKKLISRTRSTSTSGNQRLFFGSIGFGGDSAILNLRCKMPPKGKIRAIVWEEELETDQDDDSSL
jgi:hypothetical protein